MENQTLSEALEAAGSKTLPIYFSVQVPNPDTISDLLNHIQEIHNALVDAGCVSVGFPHVGGLGEELWF